VTPGSIRLYQPKSGKLHSQSHSDTADSPEGPRAEILLLTGESGAGKSTTCTRIITYARQQGLDVAGLLTLPRSGKGRKICLDVEDIRTGQRRPLAEAVGSARGPVIGQWQFHSEGLDWGNEILRRATPCDLLLIDELGPLELTRNEGWTDALDELRAGQYRVAVVSIRPKLLAAFEKQIGPLHWRALALTESNRRGLNSELKELLGAAS
jgi:nucleoside-triphosphatase THEP1